MKCLLRSTVVVVVLTACVALASCACYLRLGERKPIDFYMNTLHASEGPLVDPVANMTLLFDYVTDALYDEELTYIDVYGSAQSCVFHVYTFNNKTVRVSLTSEEPLRSLTGNMTVYGIRWRLEE